MLGIEFEFITGFILISVNFGTSPGQYDFKNADVGASYKT